MKVKAGYLTPEPIGFANWVYDNANFEEKYIEIPSNETLSGHAEILELDAFMHLFGYDSES